MYSNCKHHVTYKGRYTYEVHQSCLIFETPHPPDHLCPKCFHPLDLRRPILNKPAPHPLQQTIEQQPHRVCEWAKSKQKQNQVTSHSNWPRVLSFDLAHKQCNDIIKGWLHCLTPESIETFLVNNILMFESV